MQIFDIFLVIIGLVIILVSYFISEKLTKKQEEGKETLVDIDINELLEKEKQTIIDKIEQIILDKEEQAVIKTDTKLGKISNEKIMSLTEYSDQILEKINQNHSEVVFLYNMLNEKEQEIKEILKEINKLKIEIEKKEEKTLTEKKQIEKKPVRKKQIEKTASKKKEIRKEEEKEKITMPEREISGIDLLRKSEEQRKNTFKKNSSLNLEKSKIDKQMKIKKSKEEEKETETVSSNNIELNRNEEILKLYEEGKSILDISRLLEMGQGEVKLVIDLFCNTK